MFMCNGCIKKQLFAYVSQCLQLVLSGSITFSDIKQYLEKQHFHLWYSKRLKPSLMKP